jgi:exodeoxyribonuclease-5
MKKAEFVALIHDKLSISPTSGQKKAIQLFADYLCCKDKGGLMLLKGYAGTGKTTLVSAFVAALDELKINTVLLAPTGRAAKVLGNYSGKQAFTIHKELYKIKVSKDGTERLVLKKNEHGNTIFFVDEASMIYDMRQSDASSLFADTNLLEDLFRYVEEGINCRVVFIGDTAQLPPVGLSYSPALDEGFLRDNFSRLLFNYELTEVVRQVKKSGILYNATQIRYLIGNHAVEPYSFVFNKFPDVEAIPANQLLERLETAYQQSDCDNVVLITRSNKQANMLNKAIRAQILYREEELERNDLIMCVKNNYHWLPKESDVQFLANGDILQVIKIKSEEQRYGFRFVDVKLRLMDYSEEEIEAKLLLDSLYTEGASMSSQSRKEFFYLVMADYMHIPSRKKRFEALREDPYLNALQVKFAYAQTCHKTQGGQWDTSFIYQGFLSENMVGDAYYRWLYTAVTRARRRMYWVE